MKREGDREIESDRFKDGEWWDVRAGRKAAVRAVMDEALHVAE